MEKRTSKLNLNGEKGAGADKRKGLATAEEVDAGESAEWPGKSEVKEKMKS